MIIFFVVDFPQYQLLHNPMSFLGLDLELWLSHLGNTGCVSGDFNHSYIGVEVYQDLLLPKINLHMHQAMHQAHGLDSKEMCPWLFCELQRAPPSAPCLPLAEKLGYDSESPHYYFCLFTDLLCDLNLLTPFCLGVFTCTMTLLSQGRREKQ